MAAAFRWGESRAGAGTGLIGMRNLVREIWLRIRGSLRDDGLTGEMDEEFRFHLDQATARNLALGMSPDAARREALRAFGRLESHRLEGGDEQRSRWLEGLAHDVRMAGRVFRRSPGFALLVMLLIALGVGGNAAIFSVVNGVLLKPLPYPDSDRLLFVGWDYGGHRNVDALSFFQLDWVARETRTLDAVATWRTTESPLGEGDDAPLIPGVRVSADFFRTTMVAPIRGRAFAPEEYRPGGSDLVLVSEAFARTHLGSDTAVVGREVRLDGRSYVILGVMPEGFTMPDECGPVDLVYPLRAEPDPQDQGLNYTALARLKPGVTHAAALADIAALSRRFTAVHSEYNGGKRPGMEQSPPGFTLRTFAQVFAGDLARVLWVLFGAVAFVTIIVCVNAVSLLLARASARGRELVVRAALGAGRRRIVRQLVVESLALAIAGGILGVVLGLWSVNALLALAPSDLPRAAGIGLDRRVTAFIAGVTLLSGLAIGVTSALTATRGGVLGGAARSGRGSTGDDRRVREALLVLQTSVAVILLSGSGLLMTSFTRLRAVNPGFDPGGVLTARVTRLPTGTSEPGWTWDFEQRVLAALRVVPGVEAAAALSNFPLERGLNLPVSTGPGPNDGEGAVEWRGISPGYLATLRVLLLQGREFGDADIATGPRVGIVNEAFVKRYFPGQDPLGKQVELGKLNGRFLAPGFAGPIEIVGVAANVKEIRLDAPPRRTLYVPRSQWSDLLGRPQFVIRAAPSVSLAAVSAAIHGVDPRVPPVEPGTLPGVVRESIAEQRFQAVLLTLFGATALLLTAIGVYGVMAFNVARRTREIGVRMVLGAGRGRVLGNVLGRGMLLVGLGAALGLAGALAATRLLTGMLYDVRPGDPRTLMIAVLVLTGAAMVASLVPGMRATRVDPAEALRSD